MKLGKKAQIAIYSMVAIIACLLIVPVATSAARRSELRANIPLDRQILHEINLIRHAHNLQPLTSSPLLVQAASDHSQSMATKGFFAHTTPNSYVFWVRVERYFPSANYKYWETGENLVWASPKLTARRAVALWMKSPLHRANLLNPRYRQIGLAAVHSDGAPGVYGGQQATIITADFGVRY